VEIVGYLIPTRGIASPLIKYDRKRLTMALRAHNKILPMERDTKQYVASTNADIYVSP
jgi:hypothetical protein